MIHVVAIITAKPGQRAAVLSAFKAHMPTVRAELGCLEYVLAVDANASGLQTPLGKDSFVVVEKWANLGSLKAHARSTQMAAYFEAVKTSVMARAVHVLEEPV